MSSRSSRSRNGGISFSISLVTPRAAETVRGWRRPAISSASSMNTTTLSSSATSANASRNADARPAGESPASREGNSSTNGQPSREATPLAKVVFPAPGAEQDDGPGRDKPQPGGELRAGQRKDDPPFDQLLLPDHPAELAPRVRTDHAATELLKYADVGGPDRLQLLVKDHVAADRVPAVLQGNRAHLALIRQQARDPVNPRRHQPPFQLGQHRAADTPPPPSRRQADPQQQRPGPAGGRNHRPDQLIPNDRHDSRRSRADRGDQVG